MLENYPEALRDAESATNLEPKLTKGWRRIARCYVKLGDTISARQALEKLNSLGEDDISEKKNIEKIESMKKESMLAKHCNDYKKSVYFINKALDIATSSASLKISKAKCLVLGECSFDKKSGLA